MNTFSPPKITTIIPTFRRPKLLKRAVRSILNQTYPHFNLCIYDNASGDDTANVVQEFMRKDSRVHYHCHPQNIGAGNNFLYGLSRVDTPFFHIISDDDIILPYFYELAVNTLEIKQESSCYVGGTIRTDFDGKFYDMPVSRWKRDVYEPPYAYFEMLREGFFPEWTAIIFRTLVLKDNKMDFEVSGYSDLDFQLKIAAKNSCIVNPTPCALFSLSPILNTPRFSLHTEIPGMSKLIKNIYSIHEIPHNMKPIAEKSVMNLMQKMTFRLGIRGALTGFRDETIYAYSVFRIFFESPFQTKILEILANETAVSRFISVILSILWFARRTYTKMIPTKWDIKYKYIKKYLDEISGD